MDCGNDISVETKFKQLIVDCDGCPSLSIDPISGSVEDLLTCDEQDWSFDDIFNKLLNAAGTAIKTIT